MDKVKGSLEALSAMQITADTEGLDAESKTLLHSREVLAVILQGTIEECIPTEKISWTQFLNILIFPRMRNYGRRQSI